MSAVLFGRAPGSLAIVDWSYYSTEGRLYINGARDIAQAKRIALSMLRRKYHLRRDRITIKGVVLDGTTQGLFSTAGR